MDVDEAVREKCVLLEKAAHALHGCISGDEHQGLFRGKGLDADPAKAVEIALDRMPGRPLRKTVMVRERAAPEPRCIRDVAPDGVARREQPGEPRPARMLGQMHDQVVTTRAQG